MPIKKLTLGLGLLMAGAVMAQAETYRIREGDTISEIAARFHVKTRDILRANGLTASSNLKLGRVLYIPSASRTSSRSDHVPSGHVPSGSGTYVVRNGDHDWTLAARFGVTPTEIRRMNPGLNWRALQIGQRIHVPSGHGSSSEAPVAKVAAHKISSVGTYRIKPGDNDWIIARRFDTQPSVIRRLNPGLNWNRVQIGQVIKVPGASNAGTSGVVTTGSVKRIRSRYAVVAKEDAIIRRSPSTRGEAITTVPAGLKVVVLDRDGDWYRLRFPKGTEGWMRGDLITAASAPHEIVAARRARKARRTSTVAHAGTSGPREDRGYAKMASSDIDDRILSKAQSFRGVRYRWGASSRSATDCSGFTSQVFKSQGFRLPRTSAEQSQVGAKVSRGELKKGDLVFFRTRRGVRVSHVGIYMGNGRFIHASSGGGHVQVNSLADGYYHERFVGARRVAKPAKVSKSHVAKSTHKATASKPSASEISVLPTQQDSDAGR